MGEDWCSTRIFPVTTACSAVTARIAARTCCTASPRSRLALQLSRLEVTAPTGQCLEQPYEDLANPKGSYKTRSATRRIRSKQQGRPVVGVSRSGAGAAAARLGAVHVDQRLPADRDLRDSVQLVPVPGELDRSGALRVDARELGRDDAGRQRAAVPKHLKLGFEEFEYGWCIGVCARAAVRQRAVDGGPRRPVAELLLPRRSLRMARARR